LLPADGGWRPRNVAGRPPARRCPCRRRSRHAAIPRSRPTDAPSSYPRRTALGPTPLVSQGSPQRWGWRLRRRFLRARRAAAAGVEERADGTILRMPRGTTPGPRRASASTCGARTTATPERETGAANAECNGRSAGWIGPPDHVGVRAVDSVTRRPTGPRTITQHRYRSEADAIAATAPTLLSQWTRSDCGR
jgi:hypothetical protein